MHTQTLLTIDDIVQGLRNLGVTEGSNIFVHSAMSQMAEYICGAELAIIQALCKAVGSTGTVVMPSQSSVYSEPAYWQHPPVPQEWWQTIRDTMPAYTPSTAPVGGVGRVPAVFAKQPDVVRSNHPSGSFAAWGKNAHNVISNHSIEYSFGEQSPLATMYNFGFGIVFLGAPFESNTSLHLAEIRATYPDKKSIRQGAPILVNGNREWVEFDDLDYDSDDFDTITNAYVQANNTHSAVQIGKANCWLFPMHTMVDFGIQWMEQNRV